MWRDEGLESWMWLAGTRERAPERVEAAALARRLDELEAVLDGSSGKKEYPYLWLPGGSAVPPGALRARSEALHLRVAERGGAGVTRVETALSGMIAQAAELSSLPFWERLASVRRPRDSFARRRRELAAEAVAFLYWRGGAPAALETLVAFATGSDPSLRGFAFAAAAAVLPRLEGAPVPPDFVVITRRAAAVDQSFSPRFLARRALAVWGEALSNDVPDGAFRLTMRPVYGGAYEMQIEIPSTFCLDDLCAAVLDELGWDFDHLYQFYLDGKVSRSPFALPDLEVDSAGWGGPWDAGASQPFWPTLGEIGLHKGDKLLLRYDFGDDHRFLLRVADVLRHRRSDHALAELEGSAPAQYPCWDDDSI